jgi:hypothetical protein
MSTHPHPATAVAVAARFSVAADHRAASSHDKAPPSQMAAKRYLGARGQ